MILDFLRRRYADQIEGFREQIKNELREEFVIPRFAYHQPLGYEKNTFPPVFADPVIISGEPLPLPPPAVRMGYPADDAVYLDMGRYDYGLIKDLISRHSSTREPLDILDFGCSSGRVLRHFDRDRRECGWNLFGVDVQALPIEWMRHHFPDQFCVFTSNILPHLQLPDNSVDVIYGISVFTHIKYQWDAWLMELRRVLRPGGLLIQTIHTENAWRFYYDHRHEQWVKDGLPSHMLETREMAQDAFYYGDVIVSQVFWKREVARNLWSRYFTVIDVLPPPPRFSFQDWIICRKYA